MTAIVLLPRSTATFSPCRTYRYSLWRHWGPPEGSYAMFIGLNPSTADEVEDDPTIRRCVAFAKTWGYSGLCMTNLFAFRTKAPSIMKAEPNPVGPENDETLHRLAQGAGVVVAAWGVHGKHANREQRIRELIPNLHYLRLTKRGSPGHPLYLPKDLVPVPFGET